MTHSTRAQTPAAILALPVLTLPVLTLAVLAAASGPALAQTPPADSRSLAPRGGAAAVLPNTFDGPAAAPTPARPLPAVPAASPMTNAQAAEATLRSVIEQIRAGDIDERLFTPTVAARLNGELATYRRLIQGYGALQSIEAQGAADGVGQFLVIFDNAATQWQVGLEEGGLIAALRFREAPPESSEPEA